eukprot:366037-Chlamydomonas_euryale.AAC.8
MAAAAVDRSGLLLRRLHAAVIVPRCSSAHAPSQGNQCDPPKAIHMILQGNLLSSTGLWQPQPAWRRASPHTSYAARTVRPQHSVRRVTDLASAARPQRSQHSVRRVTDLARAARTRRPQHSVRRVTDLARAARPQRSQHSVRRPGHVVLRDAHPRPKEAGDDVVPTIPCGARLRASARMRA